MGRKPECGGAQDVREPPNVAEHMDVRELRRLADRDRVAPVADRVQGRRLIGVDVDRRHLMSAHFDALQGTIASATVLSTLLAALTKPILLAFTALFYAS